VELGKRVSVVSAEARPCIHSPQDVANLLMPELRDLKKEVLKSLLLDSKNRVMKILTVSIGILDSSLVHPREVFKDAILASSAALIVAHNHPSACQKSDRSSASNSSITSSSATTAGFRSKSAACFSL
jgi:DNA repair protein RadC